MALLKDMKTRLPIAVIQMRSVPGGVEKNLKEMLAHIQEARNKGAKLVVFPELSTSGYLLGDLWEHPAFLKEIEDANEEIRKGSKGLAVIWGSVKVDHEKIGEDGRLRKYNAAFVAQNGAWVKNELLSGWIPKTNLPKYRIFDDARHFYPASTLAREMSCTLSDLLHPFTLSWKGSEVRVGVTVCEDLWEDEYFDKPSHIYNKKNVDLLIDISQSPWTAEKWRARDRMLTKRSRTANAPILYVNSVGLQNNTKNLVWFDGNSALISEKGEFLWRAPQHEANLSLITLGTKPKKKVREHTTGIEEIYEATLSAMKEFFAPFPHIVVGLSGGIDSAVSLGLLTHALGAKKVLAVNMPTRYNSETTQDLAERCAKNFGIEYKIAPIEQLYEMTLMTLERAGYSNPSMLVRENVQARIRGKTLADIAACENGVVINNGNKTEIALNYFTLYGDAIGAGAFLGDLWKRQVYELARFINKKEGYEAIPKGIINLVPSAELSPEQNVDEGKGDPIFYPYHDELLRMFTEARWDPTEVMKRVIAGTLEKDINCAPGTLKKYFKTRKDFIENLEWAWRQYNIEYKRHQLPPVFIASRRAFGFDRRSTIANGFTTKEYARLRTQYLKKK